MNETARLIVLQNELLKTLRAISEHADDVMQVRCPYRGVGDVCTLPRGCRNQVVRAGMRHCNGAQLNHRAP